MPNISEENKDSFGTVNNDSRQSEKSSGGGSIFDMISSGSASGKAAPRRNTVDAGLSDRAKELLERKRAAMAAAGSAKPAGSADNFTIDPPDKSATADSDGNQPKAEQKQTNISGAAESATQNGEAHRGFDTHIKAGYKNEPQESGHHSPFGDLSGLNEYQTDSTRDPRLYSDKRREISSMLDKQTTEKSESKDNYDSMVAGAYGADVAEEMKERSEFISAGVFGFGGADKRSSKPQSETRPVEQRSQVKTSTPQQPKQDAPRGFDRSVSASGKKSSFDSGDRPDEKPNYSSGRPYGSNGVIKTASDAGIITSSNYKPEKRQDRGIEIDNVEIPDFTDDEKRRIDLKFGKGVPVRKPEDEERKKNNRSEASLYPSKNKKQRGKKYVDTSDPMEALYGSRRTEKEDEQIDPYSLFPEKKQKNDEPTTTAEEARSFLFEERDRYEAEQKAKREAFAASLPDFKPPQQKGRKLPPLPEGHGMSVLFPNGDPKAYFESQKKNEGKKSKNNGQPSYSGDSLYPDRVEHEADNRSAEESREMLFPESARQGKRVSTDERASLDRLLENPYKKTSGGKGKTVAPLYEDKKNDNGNEAAFESKDGRGNANLGESREPYKQKLGSLLGEQIEAAASRETVTVEESNYDTINRDYGEYVRKDIDGLQESYSSEGVGMRKRSQAVKDYQPKQVLYGNKLNMIAALISAFAVIFGLFATYLIANESITDYNPINLIYCGLIECAILVVFAVLLIVRPNKKMSVSRKPSYLVLITAIIAFLLILFVLAIDTLALATDFTNPSELTDCLIAPIILILGVPVWGILRFLLYKHFVR